MIPSAYLAPQTLLLRLDGRVGAVLMLGCRAGRGASYVSYDFYAADEAENEDKVENWGTTLRPRSSPNPLRCPH